MGPITARTPRPVHRANRLFVLTSHITASAAEVFVLSAMHLKHVTIIGSRTQGILSDMYESRLPNGWEVSLSNEIYFCAKGKVYELVGVPPHIHIDYPIAKPKALLQRLQKGLKSGDEAIERVLRLLRKTPPSNKIRAAQPATKPTPR